tara:strand:- start:898 stop:3303 length:2406 start_codon:yes stop_codon:yes gene_type:complete
MFICIILTLNLLFCINSDSDSLAFSVQDQNKKNFFSSSYKLEQWLTSDGNSEGISGSWLEKYFEPRNINLMNYDDIMSLPRISPIDAHAVIKQKQLGYINGNFELKNSGISHYGYKSLTDFISFDSSVNKKIHFRYSSLIRTTPITTNPDSEGQEISTFSSDRPEQLHRLSASYSFGKKFSIIKSGFVYKQSMGESDEVFTEKSFIEFAYVPLFGLGGFQIDRLIIGNFTASFGQGVVFENTDYFSPRRTGYGFKKRNNGIRSDLTRTSQYILDGTAVQLSNSLIRLIYFKSESQRDAIINEDGSFSSLISMEPRLSWGINGDRDRIYHNLVSSLTERTMGWDLRLGKGSNYVGLSYYRSLYDRLLIPKPVETILGGSQSDDDPALDGSDFDDYSGDAFYLTYITNSADSEIDAMYHSAPSSINSSWKDAKSLREVIGINFSTTIKNLVFQGEYAEMPNYSCMNSTSSEVDASNFSLLSRNKLMSCNTDSVLSITSAPKAMVFNVYAQFDNVNFLVLYRNYDLDFDNPYQRSFSNYQRFKTSIFEDTYWLEDPVYGFLYSGNPQPQAEEGLYISSRYQIHRSIVLRYEIDTWNRKADNTKYYRTAFNFEWRPVFNYRIYLRQKWSGRGQFDNSHPSPFDSRETRLRFVLRLSNYDNIELLIGRGYTTFSPRPRLTGSPLGSTAMAVGDIGSPDFTLGFSFSHNVDNKFSIKGGTVFVKGFSWYIEDTDFRIFDSTQGAMHNWISARFRPTNTLSVNFKYSLTDDFNTTTVVSGQTELGSSISNPLVNDKRSDYKIQVDYAF